MVFCATGRIKVSGGVEGYNRILNKWKNNIIFYIFVGVDFAALIIVWKYVCTKSSPIGTRIFGRKLDCDIAVLFEQYLLPDRG